MGFFMGASGPCWRQVRKLGPLLDRGAEAEPLLVVWLEGSEVLPWTGRPYLLLGLYQAGQGCCPALFAVAKENELGKCAGKCLCVLQQLLSARSLPAHSFACPSDSRVLPGPADKAHLGPLNET